MTDTERARFLTVLRQVVQKNAKHLDQQGGGDWQNQWQRGWSAGFRYAIRAVRRQIREEPPR